MSGPYPLATLACTVNANGISAPALSDILASLQASFQGIYGSDAVLSADSQDGQLLGVIAQAIDDSNQVAITVYNSFSPATAQGAGLSSVVKINGLEREVPTFSTATVTVIGVYGTVITNGIVGDTAGYVWDLPPSVVIPSSGSISVTVTCETPGAIAVIAGAINKINTPTLGWQTVTNPAPSIPGAPVESDSALRQRQTISTSLPAQTPLQAILANVANLPGVTGYAIYENKTSSTDANSLPPHSIAVVVAGGSAAQVALAIEEKKSPGTDTYGSTSEVVDDPAGIPITIDFFELVTVPIYVDIGIATLSNYVASTVTLIKNAVVAFINSLPIGSDVYAEWLNTPAQILALPQGMTFKVTGLTLGTAPIPTGTSDITIAFNQQAACTVANVLVNGV